MDIELLVDKYISSDKHIRQQIADTIMQVDSGSIEQATISGLYHNFMREMAKESVRQKSKALLIKGIYANVVENVSWDSRDNLTCLVLLYRSARILGLDPDQEFKTVAKDTDGKGKNLLLTFISRSTELKTLKCIGYKEITEPKFDYIDIR